MFNNGLNSGDVAKYDHLTQTIHLNRVEQDDVVRFTSALIGPNAMANVEVINGAKEILRPLVHEMRHWVDMNCSLRGLQTLRNIFKFMKRPELANTSLNGLKKDLSLFDFIQRHDPANGEALYPWHCAFTLSEPLHHEFLPHISSCFFSKTDIRTEHVLFKTPIYLGSMLETCAYFQELREAVPLILGHNSWEIQSQWLAFDELRFIKDPTLPEYHAIGHAMSAAAKQIDILEGFSIAAGLCTLLMHMPSKMLMESCGRIVKRLKDLRFDGVHAGRQMQTMTSICPEAAIIHYVHSELSRRSKSGPISYSDDLIFDLIPLWRKRKIEFFERSHSLFAQTIKSIEGPEYFCDSIPALIENNQYLLEQETLTPLILKIPKRPPIILGDANVLEGASEFDKQIPYYEITSTSEAAKLLRVQKLN